MYIYINSTFNIVYIVSKRLYVCFVCITLHFVVVVVLLPANKEIKFEAIDSIISCGDAVVNFAHWHSLHARCILDNLDEFFSLQFSIKLPFSLIKADFHTFRSRKQNLVNIEYTRNTSIRNLTCWSQKCHRSSIMNVSIKFHPIKESFKNDN